MRRLLSCLVLVGLLASCGAQSATLAPDELPIIITPTLAGTPTSMERNRLFLAQYGLKALEAPTLYRETLPDDLLNPNNHWNICLSESQKVGLDFTGYAGHVVRMYRYLVMYTKSDHLKVYAYVLTADEQIVGAWMSVETYTPGIFPINTPLDKLP